MTSNCQQKPDLVLRLDPTYRSQAYDQRIRQLVIHYTDEPLQAAIHHLVQQGKVSAHYLLPDDPQLPAIYQLVDDQQRAWHAGKSYWQGRHQLNDTSIGIELVNLGCQQTPSVFQPFAAEQINNLIKLCQHLQARYHFHPSAIVGHADIAPDRKIDPGPLFPWHTLYQAGIGAWPDQQDIDDFLTSDNPLDIYWVQQQLAQYGYPIEQTGSLDQQTKVTLSAFQMHFRPACYDGYPDPQTCAILFALVKKYRTA
jgi:N-acetylmuramoyl-L-alanine amidase